MAVRRPHRLLAGERPPTASSRAKLDDVLALIARLRDRRLRLIATGYAADVVYRLNLIFPATRSPGRPL